MPLHRQLHKDLHYIKRKQKQATGLLVHSQAAVAWSNACFGCGGVARGQFVSNARKNGRQPRSHPLSIILRESVRASCPSCHQSVTTEVPPKTRPAVVTATQRRRTQRQSGATQPSTTCSMRVSESKNRHWGAGSAARCHRQRGSKKRLLRPFVAANRRRCTIQLASREQRAMRRRREEERGQSMQNWPRTIGAYIL